MSSSNVPSVSVLMCVYNAATYLREAIDSILNQTYSDFEFLIYSDGSTDDTAVIVKSYTDPRIIFVDHKVNRSVSPNLNEGLDLARGRYIARMDGDDIAHPERLAKQVAYMDANPAVGLCGSAVRYIGASNAVIQLPVDNDAIQHTMWLQNPFYQPSVIIRASVLDEHSLRYDVNYEFAEDYKLWAEICAVTQVHNLPEVLLNYRIHPHQISRRQSPAQQRVSALIRKEQMNRLNIFLKPEQEQSFKLLTIDEGWGRYQPSDYEKIASLLEYLAEHAKRETSTPEVVYTALADQWGRILNAAKQYTPALIPFILRPPLRQYLAQINVLKLVTKCIVRWKAK
jgi:glycosyltransferase involved in cell wall biosynthesis